MDIKLIKEIRRQTGASFGDCKKALSKAGGDLSKALNIAENMRKAQQSKEMDDANAHLEVEKVQRLKSEFDDLTTIIRDRKNLNRWSQVATLIKEKYDLGLSEEEKKRHYVSSTLLTPLESVSDEIKKTFVVSFQEEKINLFNSDKQSELENARNELLSSMKRQLHGYEAADVKIDCLWMKPMLFSTSIGLTKGFNIYRTKCQGVENVIDTVFSDSWWDDDIARFTEDGTDLDGLTERESPEGEDRYYIAMGAMKQAIDGPFEQFGIQGEWKEVDAEALKNIQSLQAKSAAAVKCKDDLEIIRLFIEKIR